MNFQNMNFEHVELPRMRPRVASLRTQWLRAGRLADDLLLGPYPEQPQDPQTPSSNNSDATLRPANDDPHAHHEYASSDPATPSALPNTFPPIPSPPSTPSGEESYGPDRLFGARLVAPPAGLAYDRPVTQPGPGPFVILPEYTQTELVSLNRMCDMDDALRVAMGSDFKDALAREAGAVTPGVDNTPYIQYAIEALTRDRDTGYSGNASSSASDTPVNHFVNDVGLGYYHPREPSRQVHPPRPERQSAAPPLPSPVPQAPAHPAPVHPRSQRVPEQPSQTQKEEPFFMKLGAFQMTPRRPLAPEVDVSKTWPGGRRPAGLDEWLPMDLDSIVDRADFEKTKGYTSLNFRPTALRSPSLFVLMGLCVVMIAGIVSSAVYSQLHDGLVAYRGESGGAYFLFRVLPQLLGAVVLLYAQFVITAVFRIIPFVRLASRQVEERKDAVFQDLYPRSFLWPQLIGTWNIWVPILITWLCNFTIPLESALFTAALVDDVWVWATVQGVAWTLVALYLALFVSTAILWRYWDKVGRTGLLWDPKSLADIIVMVSDTNISGDYRGTQIAGTRETMMFKLRRREDDRLGYWAWKDGRPGFWYSLGNSMDDANFVPVPDHVKGVEMLKENEKQAAMSGLGLPSGGDHDVEALARSPNIRYRYLPWCLRSSPLLCFALTAAVFLLALFIVSFLPSTRISAGFLPELSTIPVAGAFSAADFLYSFVPSLLGMVLFLLFQSLDQSLRILQPWATLSNPRGVGAWPTLLADYAACAPLQSTYHALQNGHFRVAAVSLLSTLFILIPVMAGGVFMALTTSSGQVRMFPNMPVYSVLLVLLVLYLVGLCALLPSRKKFCLPHGVTCLAEIVSFLANEDLLADPAFKTCRVRDEMLLQMGLQQGNRDTQPLWTFSFGTEAGGDSILGVRRVRRFTEKRRIPKSQIRRDRKPAKGTTQFVGR